MTLGDNKYATAASVLSTNNYTLKRCWRILASVWLTGVIIAFVVIDIHRRVPTPISDWLQRLCLLFGL
jgi:hypothetical protein